MRIGIVSPARPGSRLGNAVTAERYAAFFRSAGWRCEIMRAYGGQDFDALVALHARKSARSALAFRRLYSARPLVVVLTGTDLYRDIRTSTPAQRALAAATALVVLQPRGLHALSAELRKKAVSIIQSSRARSVRRRAPDDRRLDVCVLGHLRSEKDPLRTALAVRALPAGVRIQVTQAGEALDARYARAARREMTRNARYRWIGDLSRREAMRLLASSDLMVLSSRLEGGANALSEAIACGVPVLASAIDGNVGILGARYAGLYPAGDTRALARLLRRAAEEPSFLTRLRAWCRALRPLVQPAKERRAWIGLLRELAGRAGARAG